MNALIKAPPLPRGGGSVCRDGGVFYGYFSQAAKQRLGSAENPSVSLRDPPSLGKGRSYVLLASRPTDLCTRDMQIYVYSNYVMHAKHQAPPLRRGGGSVCRDEGVFYGYFNQAAKQRLGSAENPSVSLREPPSLCKGRSHLLLASRPTDLCTRDMPQGRHEWTAGDMTTRKQRSVVPTCRAGFAWRVVGNDGAFPSKIPRNKLQGIKPIMNEF